MISLVFSYRPGSNKFTIPIDDKTISYFIRQNKKKNILRKNKHFRLSVDLYNFVLLKKKKLETPPIWECLLGTRQTRSHSTQSGIVQATESRENKNPNQRVCCLLALAKCKANIPKRVQKRKMKHTSTV